MIRSTTRTSSTTTISLSFVVSLFLVVSYILSSHNESKSCALQTVLLVVAGFFLVSICLIIVARTTMVAWTTVLVLLAFSGKRRRVLVHDGRMITTDVAMQMIKVMVQERQFLTVICAAIVSVLAMTQVTSL